MKDPKSAIEQLGFGDAANELVNAWDCENQDEQAVRDKAQQFILASIMFSTDLDILDELILLRSILNEKEIT